MRARREVASVDRHAGRSRQRAGLQVKPGRFDVVVVGASIGGCTTARLLAMRGARVALIERRPDPDAYKTVCTHYIQSSATPTIERIGLAPLLEAEGAIHNSIDVWSRHGGWSTALPDEPYGYSLTRRRLDPLLRGLAADTPGVELFGGWTVTGLLGGERPAGVVAENREGETLRIEARLVVAADGRDSGLARLARVPARTEAEPSLLLLGLLERPAASRTAGADVVPRTRLRLHVPQRGRADRRPRRTPRARVWTSSGRIARVPICGSPAAARRSGLLRRERESKLLGKLELPNSIRPAAPAGTGLRRRRGAGRGPVLGHRLWLGLSECRMARRPVAPALLGDARHSTPRSPAIAESTSGASRLTRSSWPTSPAGAAANFIERMMWRAAPQDDQVRRALERVTSRRAPPASAAAAEHAPPRRSRREAPKRDWGI